MRFKEESNNGVGHRWLPINNNVHYIDCSFTNEGAEKRESYRSQEVKQSASWESGQMLDMSDPDESLNIETLKVWTV